MMLPEREAVSFGPFTMIADERLLSRDGERVALGARAFDILATLSARHKEIVSKQSLLDLVWPDVTVEESSLRFHMAKLRKALGDGENGARYIATLNGRGYCFVAPISRATSYGQAHVHPEVVAQHDANLPGRLARMIGREQYCTTLSSMLAAKRFVTIVGPGGVGKTMVAVAVRRQAVEAFGGAVHFLDLGALSEPSQIAPSLASMLGLSLQLEDVVAGLTAHLANRRVFPDPRHLRACRRGGSGTGFPHLCRRAEVQIVATSREPLLAEGEHIHRLEPFALPAETTGTSAEAAQRFPAIELFIERAKAGGPAWSSTRVPAQLQSDTSMCY